MNFNNINISSAANSFFQKEQNTDFQKINRLLKAQCGVVGFFENENDYFQLFGIEIQEKYLWQLKFDLLEYFLKNPTANKPEMQAFIKSFMFTDAKRAITKDLLMRVEFDTTTKKRRKVSLF